LTPAIFYISGPYHELVSFFDLWNFAHIVICESKKSKDQGVKHNN